MGRVARYAGLATFVALGAGCGNGIDAPPTPGVQQGTGGKAAAEGGRGSGGASGTTSFAGMSGSSGASASLGGQSALGGAPGGGGVKSAGGAEAGGFGGALAGSGGSGGSGGSAGSGQAGAGMAGMSAAGAAGTAGMSGAAGSGSTSKSAGCGKAPTLKSSASTTSFNYNTLTSGGAERRYILRLPEDYDNEHPYRLILGFHGATGNGGQVAGNPAYFGLFALAEGSTVFVAPDAVDGLWSAERDTTFVDDILAAVEADLCIDTTRIVLEGFSQGGAMAQTLACARPGVFRAAVGHSAGGLARPATCEPIPYFGSLGQDENGGQETQTDFFATANDCTLGELPAAPNGGHLCSDYEDCSTGHPVRWCPYDGGHTPSPNDAGQNSSWMPAEVWAFLSQF